MLTCFRFCSFWILLLLTACGANQENAFRLVGDFEENEKIYVVYIPRPYIEELISTLSRHEQVGVLVQTVEEIPGVDAALERAGANTERLSYGVFYGADQWIRDSAPAILKNKGGELQAVSFMTSKQAFANNPTGLAGSLRLPTRHSQVNAQGGARESNGEGTAIVTEAFFRHTDPEFDIQQTTLKLKQDFGLRKVIWLPRGLVEDEAFENGPVHGNIYPIGSGGHVDEFCRFTSPNTLLLARVDSKDLGKHPLYEENRRRLEENYRILKRCRELNIIRVPAAELLFDTLIHPSDGKAYPVVLAASYLNFIIGNHVVVAARYYQPGMPLSIKDKDEQMLRILKEQFPEKEVIQLDPRQLNLRGGGFHCVTFNLPAAGARRKGRVG